MHGRHVWKVLVTLTLPLARYEIKPYMKVKKATLSKRLIHSLPILHSQIAGMSDLIICSLSPIIIRYELSIDILCDI